MKHLTALLMASGPSFEIHAVGCADIKRTVAKGKVQNRFNFKAETEHDAVYDVYSDQIDESVGDRYHTTDEAIEGFAADVHFNGCCQLQWAPTTTPAKSGQKLGFEPGAAKSTPMASNGTAKLTRDQKRQLAHAILTAADSVMDQLSGVGLKGVDQDEAAKTVAQWLHHLPVDHEWYVTTMKYLPKPDRSDWR